MCRCIVRCGSGQVALTVLVERSRNLSGCGHPTHWVMLKLLLVVGEGCGGVTAAFHPAQGLDHLHRLPPHSDSGRPARITQVPGWGRLLQLV